MMRLHILHKTRSVKTRSESGKPASRWIRYLRPASRKPCIAASSQRLRSTRFSYGQSALRYALGFTGPDNWGGKPALQRAKVTKQVSYHIFRHTFGTLLNANGENSKVVQELLRHASLKVTTDVYMQAVGPQKREAQSNLVKLVRKARFWRSSLPKTLRSKHSFPRSTVADRDSDGISLGGT